jgi:alkylhydroperoxidase/carboxymuconolactone decarboxylase family protein YurZ
MTEIAGDAALGARFKAICQKLWGPDKGDEIHDWIVSERPAHFQAMTMQVMVPIWEMDRVDIRTKILCCISLFVGLNRDEQRFFLMMAAHHGIPQDDIEEILLLIGLEAGFPTAEKAIGIVQDVYRQHASTKAGETA